MLTLTWYGRFPAILAACAWMGVARGDPPGPPEIAEQGQAEPPPAGEQRPGSHPEPPRAPPPVPGAQAQKDALFRKRLEIRRGEVVKRYVTLATRLFEKKQYVQAARTSAIAYSFSPTAEQIFQTARFAHKAERHAESLLLYQQLLANDPQTVHRKEAEAEIATLRAVLGEDQEAPPQIIGDYLVAGKQGFQAQKYGQAIEAYAAAYALKRLPRLLFNQAQAHRRASHAEEAYLMYERLLQEDPQTPVRSEALGYLGELRPVVDLPPLYRRAWFWGVVGAGVLVAGTTVGLAVGLRSGSGLKTDGGEVGFTFPALRF